MPVTTLHVQQHLILMKVPDFRDTKVSNFKRACTIFEHINTTLTQSLFYSKPVNKIKLKQVKENQKLQVDRFIPF